MRIIRESAMLKKMLGAALALACVGAVPAYAETVALVPDGSWYQFDVDESVSPDGGLGWINLSNDWLAFSLTVAAGHSVKLTVTDAGFSGDQFEVFDNGVSLGITPDAPDSYPVSIGLNFDAALANGNYSHAFYFLGEGTHTITGKLAVSAQGGVPNTTVGALNVAPVPLPASLLLLLSGGGLLSLFSRRRKSGFRAATLALASFALAAGAAQAATTTVKLIAFNDFHGNLQSPGSLSNVPVGGADALAAHVAALKAQNPNNVVVSAGDLIGASPLVSALFHDEGTIETMNRLGLEFNAVGNHEFDEGRTELLRMQKGGCHPTDASSCQGATVGTPVPFEGAKFKFLSANVVDTATGKTLFPAYGIKLVGGVRVGFIGLTLKDTPTIVTPSGVAGLSFLEEAATVNSLVPALRARGVETIVVLIHQGGFQGSAPNFINDCSAALQNDVTSPIRAIVRNLDDAVDVVISGHTHTGYNCRLPNKVGRTIPVTQASSFGRVLTDINLTIDTVTGDVTAATVNNILTDRNAVVPDAAIASIVNGYNGLVSPLANAVIGSITGPATNGANAAGEMAAGKLIADSQFAATQAPQFGGAVLALMNAGGVRNPGFTAATYPHDITYGEAFTVQPFGNSLVTMTLTGQQIRNTLEEQFVGCLGQTVQRVLQVSSNLVYSYQLANACGARVVNATLNGVPFVSNGLVLDPAATYRVTVNNFLSTGGDGFAVLAGGTSFLGGAQDIDALIAYLASYKAPNAPYNPTTVPDRITKLP